MTIGILGGGQLGRMLALAGIPLGQKFIFLDPTPDACAAMLGQHIQGKLTDSAAVEKFAAMVDVVTFESENIPVECIDLLEKRGILVSPSKEALRATQDRLEEKRLCESLGIPTAQFAAIDSQNVQMAAQQLGYPCILKTRRMGYDGKGQLRLTSEADLPQAQALVSKQPCILEQFVRFEREVCIIATRSEDGTIVYYPLTENVHRNGILDVSRAPANAPTDLERQARSIAERLLTHFAYIGTLAVECFVMSDGRLLLNEIAPRVHNSAHWTIEGAHTSQFENHVRALSGMPLGSAAARGYSAMINFIGTKPDIRELLKLEGAHIHLYGKEERPLRKIGHVTICHQDAVVLQKNLDRALEIAAMARP